jgi:hypothetical protein
MKLLRPLLVLLVLLATLTTPVGASGAPTSPAWAMGQSQVRASGELAGTSLGAWSGARTRCETEEADGPARTT